MKYIIFLWLLAGLYNGLYAQSLSRVWETPNNCYYLNSAGDQLATIRFSQGNEYVMKLHSKDGMLTDSFSFNLGLNIIDWCYHPQQQAFFMAGSVENNFSVAYIAKISLTGAVLWKKGYSKAPFTRLLLKALCPDNDKIAAGAFFTQGSTNAIGCVKFDAETGEVVYETESIIAPDFYQKTLTHIETGSDGDIYTVRTPLNLEAPFVLYRFDSETGQVVWQLDLPGIYGGLNRTIFRIDQYDNIHLASEDNHLVKVNASGVLEYDKVPGTRFIYTTELMILGNKMMQLGYWDELPAISSDIEGAIIRIFDIVTGDSILEIRMNKQQPPNNILFWGGVWESDSIFYAEFTNLEEEQFYLGKFVLPAQTTGTAVEITLENEQIRAFPNPVTGSQVAVTTTFKEGRLFLYDPTGKELLNTVIYQNAANIPIPDIPGIYWLLGVSPSGQYVSTRIIR